MRRGICSALALTLIAQFVAVGAGRVENTTLNLPLAPGSSSGPAGYRFVEPFPSLTFENPVALASPPGDSERLFVVEQPGRIIVITNLSRPTKTLFLDLSDNTLFGGEEGLLGLAFHPRYSENGRFFVFRTCSARTGQLPGEMRHDRLSEFQVSSSDPDRADSSERILFQQLDTQRNHNAGDLHFGPDGFLYVSLGDEGGANDMGNNSQTITKDFFSGILRLDLDHRPGSTRPTDHPAVGQGTYSIPADNPFVNATTFLGEAIDTAALRAEFWVVGLRNPWRMSFDSVTGELWVGDVGQNARESVYVTSAGANHGWAFREGPVGGPDSRAPDDFLTDPEFNYVAPLHSYEHGSGTERGNSIIGGRVYRGNRFPELQGQYIFADFVSGNVWALERRPGESSEVTRLTGEGGLTAFGVDPRDGELLVCKHSGSILRLQGESDEDQNDSQLPPTLADTGAFSDLVSLTPNPGIENYYVHLPFWSDSAGKRRWFCVPSTNDFLKFKTHDTFGSPKGTVWIKHMSMIMTNGSPESRRPLETRFLVRNGKGAYGITYRWDSATNATLVPEEGAEEILSREINGRRVDQVWRYPSRSECLSCHTKAAGYSLSFNAAQMHRAPNRSLRKFINAGYFTNVPPSITRIRTLAKPDNESVSLEWRVRSWLAVNCSNCHRPGGGGGGVFDLRLSTPTALADLINGPLNDNRGDPANRVVVPGDVLHSQLWDRIRTRGPGQMPPLASVKVDWKGASVVRQWIERLAVPPAITEARLEAAEMVDGFRLRVNQPANRELWIESTDSLDNGAWEPLHLPEIEELSFSKNPLEYQVELEPGESRFFRVQTEEP